MPDLPTVLRANRSFVRYAVGFLADAGIRQFLELGSALATAGAVPEVLQNKGVDARMVCVDNDPFAEREERNATAVVTNSPFTEWDKIFGDARLCAAIADRITFRCT